MKAQRMLKASVKLAVCALLIHAIATPTSQADEWDTVRCVIDYSSAQGACGSTESCGTDSVCINRVTTCLGEALDKYSSCIQQAFKKGGS